MTRDELRGVANVMARRAQLASLLLLGCVSLAMAAEKAAELSDDFLEYLGSLEGDDENWMDFAAESAASSASAKPPVKTDGDSKVAASSSSASNQTQVIPRATGVNTSATSKTGKVEK